jgi:uncharacterized DUF497 family protein
MRFEWDENKNRINLSKHGVAFEYAQRIWDDPDHLVLIDNGSVDEERWLAIGNIGYATIVVAVHTYRGTENDPVIRIISARKATKHERTNYEKTAFGR